MAAWLRRSEHTIPLNDSRAVGAGLGVRPTPGPRAVAIPGAQKGGADFIDCGGLFGFRSRMGRLEISHRGPSLANGTGSGQKYQTGFAMRAMIPAIRRKVCLCGILRKPAAHAESTKHITIWMIEVLRLLGGVGWVNILSP